VPLANPLPKNPKVVAVDAPSGPEYLEQLRTIGIEAGLHTVGVAPATTMHRALAQLHDRQERGLVNDMKFTYLRPERSTNPGTHVEGAASVIVGVRSYAIDDDDDATIATSPLARIARYAWVDHYSHLKDSLSVVAARLRTDGHRAVVFADDNAIVDRETAWLAGIGWYGHNANILLPGHGSFFVIGCVVTTAVLPIGEPIDDGCGTCNRCVPACPTHAIIEHGVIDANRCLSWLLQKPGIFDAQYRVALADRIYGCDDCQTVCPPTRRGPLVPSSDELQKNVDVLAWLALGDAELNEQCARWYVHQRNMTWVRRNLLIVLGNVGDPTDGHVVDTVRHYLSHEQPELRAHAVWAASRLGLGAYVDHTDNNEMVRNELHHLPALRDDL
jgi:epoxyqueuosine reductase